MLAKLLLSATLLVANASAFRGSRRYQTKARTATADAENPKEYFFTTDVDHFDNGGASAKFQMRYLVDDTYWEPETGPILFYAGNEGDIYSFYDNTGFMTETVAKETKGLIVFGEHRYFGVSYPFEPSVAFNPGNNNFLTVEQVMVDYVELIKFVREEYAMQDKACVVFGGSYGGMLAAWLRMKYPQTFQGALAASAPILYFQGAPSAPEYAYGDIATTDFRNELDKSPELIREAWGYMTEATEDKYAEMSQIFNTCTPIANSTDLQNLYSHLSNGYQYMAMTDYPYPASFLEPMPAWPIKEAVKPFADIPTLGEIETRESEAAQQRQAEAEARPWYEKAHEKINAKINENLPWKKDAEVNGNEEAATGLTDRERSLFAAIAESTNVYFNYTGQYPCTNLSDWEGTGDLDGYGWNILACNQMAMPIGMGPDSMFIPFDFDYDAYTKQCEEQYGLTPDYQWALREFGGFNNTRDFKYTTNIVFSNGELDPWRAGGLNDNVSMDGSSIALYIAGGAHHLDLRTPEDDDPQVLTDARAIEMENIKKWIAEYQDVPYEPPQN